MTDNSLRHHLLSPLLIVALLCPLGWAHEAQSPVVTIYVVSHGWHTTVVVPRHEIPSDLWPGEEDFSQEEFLEFGWGDEGFYRAKNPSLLESLKAAILPSAAVLHVVGFRKPVSEFFPASGVIAIELPPDSLYSLVQFLNATIAHHGDRAVTPLGRGLYGRSYFYAARGEYTLFNNCNHWVARALNAAGLPVDPGDAMTATSVFDQAQRIGTIIRNEP